MAKGVSEPKDAPTSPGFGSAPNPGAGRLGLWNRGSLRATTTVAVLGITLAFLAVGTIAYWRLSAAVNRLERSRYQSLAAEVGNRVDHLIGRDRGRLAEAAFSDELYQSVQQGAVAPDSTTSPSFVEWFAEQYDDEFIAVYDLGGKELFTWSNSVEAPEPTAVINPFLRTLDNREPAAGIVRRGDDLMWVAGAPILPADYRDASRPIVGYLVVARPVGGSLAASLAGDQPMSLHLKPGGESDRSTPAEITTTTRGDSARVRFALADVFAARNVAAELAVDRTNFRAVDRTFGVSAALGFVLLLGVSGLLWWTAQRSIVAPATRLAGSLEPVHRGDVPPLVPCPVPSDEWTAVTGAVNRLIANGRANQERFERACAAVRDGVWERDLTTGDWAMSARFGELLGYAPGELPSGTSLETLLHPDERQYVLDTIQTSGLTARALRLDVQLRLKSGEYGWFRLEADRRLERSTAANRLTGRLVNLAPEREAQAAIEQVESDAAAVRQSYGRLLAVLGEQLARHDPARGTAVMTLGQAWSGALTKASNPFDLHQLVQAIATTAPIQVEIAVNPGLPARVSGDAGRIRQALDQIVKNAAAVTRNGRIELRVDRPDGRPAEWVEFSVTDFGGLVAEEDRTRIAHTLATGEAATDGQVAGLGLRLVYEIARLHGGSAGAGFASAGGARIWFALPLPAAVHQRISQTTVDPAADPAMYWVDPGPEARFERVSDSVAIRRSGPRPSDRVELVADATVVIDLDGPEPTKRNGGADLAILARLSAGGQTAALAKDLASMFLQQAPARLMELGAAIRAGEVRTAASVAATLKGMAHLIGAANLATECQAVEDAADGFGLAQIGLAPDRVAAELERVRRRLQPIVAPPAPDPAPSPIDPATLEQIRSSLSRDGSSLGNRLASLFLTEAPAKLGALVRAARTDDRGAGRTVAGDLAGMCDLVGARAMARICREIGNGEPANAERIAALASEYARVRKVLEELPGAGAGA